VLRTSYFFSILFSLKNYKKKNSNRWLRAFQFLSKIFSWNDVRNDIFISFLLFIWSKKNKKEVARDLKFKIFANSNIKLTKLKLGSEMQFFFFKKKNNNNWKVLTDFPLYICDAPKPNKLTMHDKWQWFVDKFI
jgi:hypothetical protein